MVGFVLLQRRHSAIVWFAIMMLASAIWAIAYALELASGTLEQMLLWIKFEYIGIAFLPSLLIMFVLNFVQRKNWITPLNVGLAFFIPATTMVMVLTNDYHHLHYLSTQVDASGPFPQ